jgi:sugar phosphate isomerase/epimerase
MTPRPIALITGSRTYPNATHVWQVLDEINPGLVIQGGAEGADRHAREWCHARGVRLLTVPALWTAHGPKAGPLRNRDMVEMARRIGCRLVVAFPGGSGTADCVAKARAAGFEVREEPDPLRSRAESNPTVRRLLTVTQGVIEAVEPSPLATSINPQEHP